VKLRRLPEDFQVDELTNAAATGGAFAFYRLKKKSIGTPEAISAIVERWKVQRKRISFGGLKDRDDSTSDDSQWSAKGVASELDRRRISRPDKRTIHTRRLSRQQISDCSA
jgi:tRNA(Glu) U13 pseudouridine synthase TruD